MSGFLISYQNGKVYATDFLLADASSDVVAARDKTDYIKSDGCHMAKRRDDGSIKKYYFQLHKMAVNSPNYRWEHSVKALSESPVNWLGLDRLWAYAEVDGVVVEVYAIANNPKGIEVFLSLCGGAQPYPADVLAKLEKENRPTIISYNLIDRSVTGYYTL